MSTTSTPTTADEASVRFPSQASLRAAHRELLQRRRLSDETPEFWVAVDAFIRRGQATGALLDSDEDRWSSQSLLDYWANALYHAGLEPPDATLAEFDPALAPPLEDAQCPYLGLDAFREADHEIFFGRRRLVEEMVRRLEEKRLLAVVGPSGSGKSSLVLAGLLPDLKDGALPGSQDWRYYPPMVPGSNPLANLARLLRPPGIDTAGWDQRQIEGFQQDANHLARLIRASDDRPVVLVIDQFEELFTLCDDDRTRQAFIENLLGMVQSPDDRHSVILTMRIDFEPHVARLPAFQPLFEEAQVRVTPLSAAELREAIEEPAKLVGLKFEEGVVDALLRDILGEPAALPLLQFTLLKLWESRERNWVTWEAYRRLGGGRQALARSADEFYQGLIPEDQVTARRILLRMVRPGEGLEVTSNRIRRETLYQAGEARDRVDRVLDRLIQARLVRLTEGDTPGDAQVEVAHEALVRNWPRLVEWLEDERESMRQRLRLTAAAEQWKAVGEDPGALWGGSLLDEARRYEDLNELETEFVRASLAAAEQAEQDKEAARQRELRQAQALAEAERQRAKEQAQAAAQLRQRAFYLSVALAVALTMAIIATFFGWQARQSEREAVANAATAIAERDKRGTAEAVAATATTALDPKIRNTVAYGELQTAQAEATTAAAQLAAVPASSDPTAIAVAETATAAAQSLQIAEQNATAAAGEYGATATPAAVATARAELKERLARAGFTGRGVKIAIVDSGIDPDHPDFAGRIAAAIGFVGDESSYRDDNGHGTFLASIVAGSGAASGGLYTGWAPEAELYIAKVLSGYGGGSLNDVIAGVNWAVEQNVDILLLSLGHDCDSYDALASAADAAVEAGIVVVVPVGVSGPEPGTVSSPGCARLPITVGAVTSYNEVASYSSRGPTFDGRVKPDLVYSGSGIGAQASGTAVGRVVATGYVEMTSGTSSSAGHVAGAVALLLQADPNLTPAEVKDLLKDTAADLGFEPNAQGAGLMSIEPALARVEAQ